MKTAYKVHSSSVPGTGNKNGVVFGKIKSPNYNGGFPLVLKSSRLPTSNMVKILLIGSGGREHAIAWKLAQSPQVTRVFVAPGNGGTQKTEKLMNVPISATPSSFEGLGKFAHDNHVDLVVIGPEQPLVDGISEFFKKMGIPCFGPSSKAALIEASKSFSKDFMKKHNIPTAEYKTFTEYSEASQYIESITDATRIVIKASGLAAGKGVILPADQQEARDTIRQIMVQKEFGTAGDSVVIEDRLEGPELSVFAFSDGYSTVILPPAQDHKRVGEDDTGLNTGGMGAFCPSPICNETLLKEIHSRVIQPTVDGLRRSGTPYVGLLYAGILLDKVKGVQVLEYNCRFGDPETQAVMLLLESDLYEIMLACVEGRLDSVGVNTRSDLFAANVVVASGGYPGSYQKGHVITGLDGVPDDVIIFHAGTTLDDHSQKVITSGGRVLNVSTTGKTLQEALDKIYSVLPSVQFEGSFYRKDIGRKASQYKKETKGVTYKDAGVDIDSGNNLVDIIKPITKATKRIGCDAEIGGFGGLFDLKPLNMKDPIIVSGTDGVGTKLLIAHKVNVHDTIGIDLVAMSVNDVLAHGAEPLFFLDYFATGKLDVRAAADVVRGIGEGCKRSGCALIGGETAEMPGLYAPGEYDLAGFAVAVVERSEMLPKRVSNGDVMIGLTSSGIHSNGYSLVRHITEKIAGLNYHDEAPFSPGKKMWEILLAPTKIYVKPVLAAIKGHSGVKAVAHITGGGFTDNIPRVFGGANVSGHVRLGSWPFPPLFQWLQKTGNVSTHEMLRTFNCGVGLVLVVAAEQEADVLKTLRENGEEGYVIGQLEDRKEGEEEMSSRPLYSSSSGGGGRNNGYQRKVPMYAIFLVYMTVIHFLLILGNVFVTCVTYHWNQRILLNKVNYLLESKSPATYISDLVLLHQGRILQSIKQVRNQVVMRRASFLNSSHFSSLSCLIGGLECDYCNDGHGIWNLLLWSVTLFQLVESFAQQNC
ncbi:hypothetical protein PROFUN_02066 [Planoprotostelium fungivorum]|uniref:Phosphoribosylformylglycinamidine cyclo-ligase n=1 Tax=Planoprotostelium fungivorum TaxID=1890364 RepID=A0A2P6NBA2_9EUKA|nr:hypothetical protein PROFUN_02066 [Planoprotostelium fungivorum]